MNTFWQELAAMGGGILAGLLLGALLPWKRSLMALGPLGILGYLLRLWQGLGPGVAVSFGLLSAFVMAGDAVYPAGRPRRSFLFLCALIGLLFFHRGWGRLDALRSLGRMEERVEDGVVLQSTGYTCAAASAATCLRHLGLPATEREMAIVCETSSSGTAPGAQAGALADRLSGEGWTARRRQRTWETLPRDGSPAILDTSWGHAKHATAFLGFEDGKAVLGEPMEGRCLATREELEGRWHWEGGGTFFERR